MFRKLFVITSALFLAFGVLFISIFESAAVRYEFGGECANGMVLALGDSKVNVVYDLAYPGRVLPDSSIWFVKALRDKIWLTITTDRSRKSELLLLFADKRVGSAKILFEKNKAEVGFSTLTKAEKYLEKAVAQESSNRKRGIDTTEFLKRLANASLKHYEVVEEILLIAPEDAKPEIIQVGEYSKRAYEHARNALLEKDIQPPEDPFGWR